MESTCIISRQEKEAMQFFCSPECQVWRFCLIFVEHPTLSPSSLKLECTKLCCNMFDTWLWTIVIKKIATHTADRKRQCYYSQLTVSKDFVYLTRHTMSWTCVVVTHTFGFNYTKGLSSTGGKQVQNNRGKNQVSYVCYIG